ncbi:MAG TPA: hypothetical protein VIH61_02090, partial [Waddliaceae bacterium]
FSGLFETIGKWIDITIDRIHAIIVAFLGSFSKTTQRWTAMKNRKNPPLKGRNCLLPFLGICIEGNHHFLR